MIPHTPKGTVVVLGGGLAGLSTLWHLQRAGYDSSFLFEKESRVGGLARSEDVAGFTFDYTGHLLHFNRPAIQQLVEKLLGENLRFLPRNSWVYSKGVYTRYPFQTNLYGLPPQVIEECISGYIEATQSKSPCSTQTKNPSDYPSFADWIDRTLGSGIARHFMTPYNEKLWTIPLQELTCEWMGRFVPTTSLEQILDGAREDCKHRSGYNARFGYPIRGGIEALPRAFSRQLRQIHTGYEAVEIDPKDKLVTFSNGETMRFQVLVSTLPLPRLICAIKEAPATIRAAASRLRFTSVFNVNFGVKRSLGDRHWIYVPEPEFLFYRIGFSHNFSPYQAPTGCSSIYAEVAYSLWRPLDKSQAAARVKADLVKARILEERDEIVAECCLDIPWAYVIYDHGTRQAVDQIQNYLLGLGIWSIGRYGAWEYSGMDEAIWQGKLVADRIIEGSH